MGRQEEENNEVLPSGWIEVKLPQAAQKKQRRSGSSGKKSKPFQGDEEQEQPSKPFFGEGAALIPATGPLPLSLASCLDAPASTTPALQDNYKQSAGTSITSAGQAQQGAGGGEVEKLGDGVVLERVASPSRARSPQKKGSDPAEIKQHDDDSQESKETRNSGPSASFLSKPCQKSGEEERMKEASNFHAPYAPEEQGRRNPNLGALTTPKSAAWGAAAQALERRCTPPQNFLNQTPMTRRRWRARNLPLGGLPLVDDEAQTTNLSRPHCIQEASDSALVIGWIRENALVQQLGHSKKKKGFMIMRVQVLDNADTAPSVTGPAAEAKEWAAPGQEGWVVRKSADRERARAGQVWFVEEEEDASVGAEEAHGEAGPEKEYDYNYDNPQSTFFSVPDMRTLIAGREREEKTDSTNGREREKAMMMEEVGREDTLAHTSSAKPDDLFRADCAPREEGETAEVGASAKGADTMGLRNNGIPKAKGDGFPVRSKRAAEDEQDEKGVPERFRAIEAEYERLFGDRSKAVKEEDTSSLPEDSKFSSGAGEELGSQVTQDSIIHRQEKNDAEDKKEAKRNSSNASLSAFGQEDGVRGERREKAQAEGEAATRAVALQQLAAAMDHNEVEVPEFTRAPQAPGTQIIRSSYQTREPVGTRTAHTSKTPTCFSFLSNWGSSGCFGFT